MKVLLLEDDDLKAEAVRAALVDRGVHRDSITRLTDLAQLAGLRGLFFDLCIIDLIIPSVAGSAARNSGSEILRMLEYAGMHNVPTLALTAFPAEALGDSEKFLRYGCIVFDYDKDDWKHALTFILQRSRDRGRYDFLIFVALDEERRAYSSLPSSRVTECRRGGYNFWEFSIGTRVGALVKLPRAGLVNAAAVVSKLLEQYSPKVACMSGICAGFADEVDLGELLIVDVCWEYQSGKWKDQIFLNEPYQVNVPECTRQVLEERLDDPVLLRRLEEKFQGRHRPSRVSAPRLAPFTTGSAVIADPKFMSRIQDQHRKVAGLDMEAFGFHRAVELAPHVTHSFCCKVVVDLGDGNKDDHLHEYGCVVSASCTLEFIEALL